MGNLETTSEPLLFDLDGRVYAEVQYFAHMWKWRFGLPIANTFPCNRHLQSLLGSWVNEKTFTVDRPGKREHNRSILLPLLHPFWIPTSHFQSHPAKP